MAEGVGFGPADLCSAFATLTCGVPAVVGLKLKYQDEFIFYLELITGQKLRRKPGSFCRLLRHDSPVQIPPLLLGKTRNFQNPDLAF